MGLFVEPIVDGLLHAGSVLFELVDRGRVTLLKCVLLEGFGLGVGVGAGTDDGCGDKEYCSNKFHGLSPQRLKPVD